MNTPILPAALRWIILALCGVAPLSAQTQTPGGAFVADWYGDSASRLITLQQGWSAKDRERFYSTTQGSQLLPYAFYLALEQAGSRRPFNDRENILRFRAIPREPSAMNPDGLPVGFAADSDSPLPQDLIRDRRSLGFTCAACHTAQINYRGTALRIDGGPTLADMASLINALEAAIVATLGDEAKFRRFAAKVFEGEPHDAARLQRLRASLKSASAEGARYLRNNHSDLAYGFGRMDAFGRIFNRALEIIESPVRFQPNAPVSFPFLWDTSRADCVQWTGSAKNGLVGSLARNVGEVVGVFAAVNTTGRRPPLGYESSARFHELRELERQIRALKSPRWPASVFPVIDSTKAAAGKVLFKDHCARCHAGVNSSPLSRSFTSMLTPIGDRDGREGVHTDATAAALIRDRRAPTGILRGAKKKILFGDTYGPTESVAIMTEDTVGRVLVGDVVDHGSDPEKGRVKLGGNGLNESANADDITQTLKANETVPVPALVYRARPLDGIWATAPYLHNGSVPTLYDLLLPESRRPKTFSVGRREYDPIRVGYETGAKPGTFTYDTRLKGNSNKGHDYGTSRMTDEQRWALVEYLKTL